MRKPLIAANWKMYKTPAESLAYVIDACKGSGVDAGAQTMHWLNEGPYTGQTSPTMLASIGCDHVLLGHSERRIYANETDDMVNWKLKAAIAHDLVPIVCVGESLEKRQSGLTEAVLRWQISCALNGIPKNPECPINIAYEPVWAIGTGSTASPDQVAEAHRIIRREVAERLGPECAEKTRIIYGGSVNANNIASLMAEPEIDGALVGGASLDPKSFAKIAMYDEI